MADTDKPQKGGGREERPMVVVSMRLPSIIVEALNIKGRLYGMDGTMMLKQHVISAGMGVVGPLHIYDIVRGLEREILEKEQSERLAEISGQAVEDLFAETVEGVKQEQKQREILAKLKDGE